jgi:hypothetical protein
MSQKLISTISKSADNVEFSSYSDIASMIKESTMRHIFFDRIVFSEKILKNPEVELKALNDYIAEFSDNTKIVFICQGKGTNNHEVFNNLFDSPLYTVVLIEKVSTNILLDFVKGDITELKAKYYSLDVKSIKSMTSKSPEGVPKEKEVPLAKKEKKGFFKSIFGGKKNNHQKIENQKSDIDGSSNSGKGDNLVSQNSLEVGAGIVSSGVALGTEIGAGTSAIKTGVDVIGSVVDSVPVSSRTSDFNDQNSYNSLDDDFLGLGGLGEQHVDTGFLDDDSQNEIDEVLKSLEDDEGAKVTYNNEEEISDIDNYNKNVEQDVVENRSSTLDDSLSPRGSSNELRYRLVVGERGIGSTSYIVDYSATQASKGKKVLIIDLDTVDNGILSYIDANSFYGNDRDCGIERMLVYTEDNVDILSNGYGRSISKESLGVLVSSGLLDKYDIVFIDCPIDCIGNLSEDLVSKCVTMVKVGGNKGSLLSVISKLTSREYISPYLEDLLYQNCKFNVVNKIDYYLEDLSFLRDTCLFGRGNWLNKVN